MKRCRSFGIPYIMRPSISQLVDCSLATKVHVDAMGTQSADVKPLRFAVVGDSQHPTTTMTHFTLPYYGNWQVALRPIIMQVKRKLLATLARIDQIDEINNANSGFGSHAWSICGGSLCAMFLREFATAPTSDTYKNTNLPRAAWQHFAKTRLIAALGEGVDPHHHLKRMLRVNDLDIFATAPVVLKDMLERFGRQHLANQAALNHWTHLPDNIHFSTEPSLDVTGLPLPMKDEETYTPSVRRPKKKNLANTTPTPFSGITDNAHTYQFHSLVRDVATVLTEGANDALCAGTIRIGDVRAGDTHPKPGQFDERYKMTAGEDVIDTYYGHVPIQVITRDGFLGNGRDIIEKFDFAHNQSFLWCMGIEPSQWQSQFNITEWAMCAWQNLVLIPLMPIDKISWLRWWNMLNRGWNVPLTMDGSGDHMLMMLETHRQNWMKDYALCSEDVRFKLQRYCFWPQSNNRHFQLTDNRLHLAGVSMSDIANNDAPDDIPF